MLKIGIRAAHAAGDHIVKYMDRLEGITINSKGRNDFVSEVDHQAESIIIETIQKSYPGHGFLAEERGKQGDSEYQWVIDPLDGTTNFLHGFPQFAVSIALMYRGQPEQAIVYDPLRQELFTASKGAGAYMNNRRMRVSKRKSLQGALLGTGFPFGDNEHMELFISTFKALFPLVAGIRRAGAASLDLAYVACGRLDGFWEIGLHIWDIAAGDLLIRESGGIITAIDGNPGHLESGTVLAGPLPIHKHMLDTMSHLDLKITA
jgi:myo-inositol-1(or 4)-monophosphatase